MGEFSDKVRQPCHPALLPHHHPFLQTQGDAEPALAENFVRDGESQPRLRLSQPDECPRLRPAERAQGRHIARRLKKVGFPLRVGPAQERPRPGQRHIHERQVAKALQGDPLETHRPSQATPAASVHLVLADRHSGMLVGRPP